MTAVARVQAQLSALLAKETMDENDADALCAASRPGADDTPDQVSLAQSAVRDVFVKASTAPTEAQQAATLGIDRATFATTYRPKFGADALVVPTGFMKNGQPLLLEATPG